jgi:hypothetical protein
VNLIRQVLINYKTIIYYAFIPGGCHVITTHFRRQSVGQYAGEFAAREMLCMSPGLLSRQ